MFEHLRAAGRRLALRADHVFDRHRQSSQPPDRFARAAPPVDLFCGGQRSVAVEPQKRLHASVVLLDPIQEVLRNLDRGQIA